MKVQEAMMGTPAYCTPQTNLGAAIELLWNRNCGILPIVDAQLKVVGVVTDRDLCIALGTRNQLPGQITVGEVVGEKVYSCHAQDNIQTALQTMADRQVRRLPVVNRDGVLEGILSMDDVILHADSDGPGRPAELGDAEIVRILRRIYSPQLPQVVQARAVAV